MSDQFEVLFYGFGGQSVLSEYKVFSVDESVHLAHRHVGQEVLDKGKENTLLNILFTEENSFVSDRLCKGVDFVISHFSCIIFYFCSSYNEPFECVWI